MSWVVLKVLNEKYMFGKYLQQFNIITTAASDDVNIALHNTIRSSQTISMKGTVGFYISK